LQALELLSRYDPGGDHRSLIELPQEYVQEMNSLKQSNQELTKVLDALLYTLLTPLDGEGNGAGGAAAAAAAVRGGPRSAKSSAAKKNLLDIARERGIAIPPSFATSDDNGHEEEDNLGGGGRMNASAAAASSSSSSSIVTPGKGLAGQQHRRLNAAAATPGPSPLTSAKTPARTPAASRPTTGARTGGGRIATAAADGEDDDVDSDDPVMASLRSVLPPGSVAVIRKHQDRLPAATPMLTRTARKTGAGGDDGNGGGLGSIARGLDNWIINHVVPSGPPTPSSGGADETHGDMLQQQHHQQQQQHHDRPARQLRFAAPPGDANEEEDGKREGTMRADTAAGARGVVGEEEEKEAEEADADDSGSLAEGEAAAGAATANDGKSDDDDVSGRGAGLRHRSARGAT
jgi:hypothetical protein